MQEAFVLVQDQAHSDYSLLDAMLENAGQAFIDMTKATRFFTMLAIFARPCILYRFNRIAPAGAYIVDVEEERSQPTADARGGWRQVRMRAACSNVQSAVPEGRSHLTGSMR